MCGCNKNKSTNRTSAFAFRPAAAQSRSVSTPTNASKSIAPRSIASISEAANKSRKRIEKLRRDAIFKAFGK